MAAAAALGAAAPPQPSGLSARELAGARVAYGFAGTSAPRPLLRRIAGGQVGGVILFARNIRTRGQVRALVRRLQGARPGGMPPLIVAIDQEGGLVKRLPGAPARSAAEMRTEKIALRQGTATGRNLRGVGVNVDLAPVVDVARPGTIMRAQRRSFGGSAGRVSRLALAFAEGLARGGDVAGTGKHFPGLGLARGDQDRSVNTIRASRRTLRSVDEAPYRELGSALPMVMVSSAIYPALDRGTPALFSRRIATGELRGQVGFTGVSVSDALDVPSVLRYGGPGERGVRSARAGVDLLLYGEPRAGAAAQGALARAIRRGGIGRAGVERSTRRILDLRDGLPR